MKLFYLLSLLLYTQLSTAQSIYPSTINITGNSGTVGNYQFELSIGESASITTMTNNSNSLMVTSGVLQSFTAYQSPLNYMPVFLPAEIKIYPNPTKGIVEVNFLQKLIGTNKMELFDAAGKKIMDKQVEYAGLGKTEKWDLSKLAQGAYLLVIQHISPATGKVVKKGVYKILKIQ